MDPNRNYGRITITARAMLQFREQMQAVVGALQTNNKSWVIIEMWNNILLIAVDVLSVILCAHEGQEACFATSSCYSVA